MENIRATVQIIFTNGGIVAYPAEWIIVNS
jgi:hypothetical protein